VRVDPSPAPDDHPPYPAACILHIQSAFRFF
jgi:hypothetical protein